MICLYVYRVYGSHGDYPAPCASACDGTDLGPNAQQICLEVPEDIPLCGSDSWWSKVRKLKRMDNSGIIPTVAGARVYSNAIKGV